jgi:AcrR family transcriptional regulator
MGVGAPIRRERDRRRHRQEILEAAERVFAEKGYGRARMREIADRAGFSVGYLYRFWPSKKDLFLDLFRAKSEEFRRLVLGRMEEAPGPVERIEALVDVHFELLRDHRDFFRIFSTYVEVAGLGMREELGREVDRARQRWIATVEKVVRDGVERKRFVALPPRTLAVALSGLIFAFMREILRSGRRAAEDLSADRLKQVYFDAVLVPRGGRGTRRKGS